ncbi:unnamed protein product [Withania somnifera]
MACSSPSPVSRLSLERRPKLLKEFLLQDDPYSCSPNDFGSHHKESFKSTRTQNIHGSTFIRSNNKGSSQLLRSRSSRAATATISAINKLINVVKFLPFASVKSPSLFPRSISRKLSNKTNNYKKSSQKHGKNINVDQHVSVTVKVKDILRWKSFRDLGEEKSMLLDSSYSPYKWATTTITTTSPTTTINSKRTSWWDSDFTAKEDLPSWCGENGEFLSELLEDGTNKVGRKNNILEGSTVRGYCMGTTKSINNKEELCFDENEQRSPVSILESPFQEDDEEGIIAFSFHERKSMLMQRIQQFESLVEENTSSKIEELKEDEEIQEKAKELLIKLKEMEDCEANYYMDDDQLLFDFFWNELITSGRHQNKLDEKLMREAKSLINGDYNGEFEWEIEEKREAYIRDMERVANWKKIEEEKQNLILDLEFEVFNDLVHQVLEDVFSA